MKDRGAGMKDRGAEMQGSPSHPPPRSGAALQDLRLVPQQIPGRGPGRPSGRMFPPRGCRRSFPGEPAWWDGPWPRPPPGPEDAWDEPPWERRRRWCPPHPRPFPGPGDGPWNEEEDRRWAPYDCPPPPPWDDREAMKGPEDGFEECWYLDPPPDPWPEYPEEEQPPPWPPAGPPRIRGAFRGQPPPWSPHCPDGRHGRRPRRSHLRQLTLVPRALCPRPPRGHKPHSKPSPALSKSSQPAARKEPQPPDPPQPLIPSRGAAERPGQTQVVGFSPSPRHPPSHTRSGLTLSLTPCRGFLQDVPVGTGKVPEPPSRAGSPAESPAAAPGAAMPVELEAGQTPVGSQEQDSCALGTDPAPPEESSAGIQECLEVEPCAPDVPTAGPGAGARPQSPAAPPDPAERELLERSSSGEEGAELSPHSREQHPGGAGEAEAAAAQDGPPQSLQPPENPQVPAGAAAEPEAEPSRASPAACTTPETPPGPRHPPGRGETKPAVSGQHQLCSTLPTPFPARIDCRSAAVLARKEEIELSYQQFSLTIAVVATMLLQKEPSMEAPLGLALRANLRQRCIHHLQELEEFIDSYDAATASL